MFANEFGRNRLPLSFFVAAVIAFFYRLQKHSSIFRFFAKLVNKAMARRALKWVVMQTRGLIWALVCKLLPFTPLYDLCLQTSLAETEHLCLRLDLTRTDLTCLMSANGLGRNRLPLSFFFAAVIAFFYRLQKYFNIFWFFAELVNKVMARRALKWVAVHTRGLIWALVCKLLPFTPLYDLCLRTSLAGTEHRCLRLDLTRTELTCLCLRTSLAETDFYCRFSLPL